ncbi:MAG: hypothetical protein VB089_22510 [Anaerolineaceae bacterium]|nr:hypothetical protein [Anaerolineaceae bacterium]
MGVNYGYLLVHLINLGLILLWPVLSVLALFGLRRQALGEALRFLWAVFIVIVPLMGAIAFWIVKPGSRLAEPTAGQDEA